MPNKTNQNELKVAEEIARFATAVASDNLASDILLLNVSNITAFADYLIILTVGSARQMSSLVDEFEISLKSRGIEKLRKEGTSGSGWVVIDFGDIVIHLFGKEEREYYALESIWSNSQELVRIQ